MPSNALKVSQFVALLEQLKATHGDLDVVLAVSALGAAVAVDGRNVNVAVELPFGRMPAPVLAIGLWSDHAGVTNSQPGQIYQSSDDGPTAWNYNRAAAPSGPILRVWKRYGGEDRGYRDGDRWYVYEGGSRAMEITPPGILAWALETSDESSTSA